MTQKEKAARLRTARKKAGFDEAEAAAEFLGMKASTYRSHENGTRGFDENQANFYARRFKVPVEWLLFGPGSEPPPHAVLPENEGDARDADVPAPLLSELKNDVPVMGTAAAAAVGGFHITGAMVDVVPRPRGIMSARDVYAIFVVGHSMEPQHPAGELRYVNPHRPIKPGDTVVVRTKAHESADEIAYLGIFDSQDEKHIVLKKLNPPATARHVRAFVTGVHKVLTLNELMGV